MSAPRNGTTRTSTGALAAGREAEVVVVAPPDRAIVQLQIRVGGDERQIGPGRRELRDGGQTTGEEPVVRVEERLHDNRGSPDDRSQPPQAGMHHQQIARLDAKALDIGA